MRMQRNSYQKLLTTHLLPNKNYWRIRYLHYNSVLLHYIKFRMGIESISGLLNLILLNFDLWLVHKSRAILPTN